MWWWSQASEHPTTSHTVSLRGARLHYRRWTGSQGPLLLFVHGFRGHTHWWDWIAPSFASDFDVVALDLSGMGDSEWRPVYTDECFAEDILGLVEHLARPAIVVGHSFGGTQLLRACALDSASSRPHIEHAIVVDSWVRVRDESPPPPSVRSREIGPYPDFETARSRFRLNPVQPVTDETMMDHLARHSVRSRDGHWQWKFDPALQASWPQDAQAMLRRIDVPVDIVYGEASSVVTRDKAQACVDALARARGPVAIPQARHHMMFDQPIALVATLRALLATRR